MPSRIRNVLIAGLLFAATPPAQAAWTNDSAVNLKVCGAANAQDLPRIVSDGAGGAIVTWEDPRGTTAYDVYVQHVLASGSVDPAWPVDGRAVCALAQNQIRPVIASDGAGGAIVAWIDRRNSNYDIFAHHVLASGALDPAWPVDGRALCVAANTQFDPQIVSDGAGGAIVTWEDVRNPTYDIFAQHVLASGAVDPAWPADGRALCLAAGNQEDPQIVPDGAGGAIVTWQDLRNLLTYDVYAQRVLASGAVDPAWPADGRAICAAAGHQLSQRIATDAAGGAIVTWYDLRGGVTSDVFAQRVLASGAVDPAWPVDGRSLCAAANNQTTGGIVPDGAGGAIVSWHDFRGGATSDVYAQRVLVSGAVDPAWPADGRSLCVAAGNQNSTQIAADGSGGAIVAWQDARGGATFDIYSQHVLASGAVDPVWPADGRALSTAVQTQENPQIVSDGNGGAIVAWEDLRGGATDDLYAQRVEKHGLLGSPEPEIVSVKDVFGDQGGRVKLSWNASYLDPAFDPNLDAYDLLRSVPESAVAAARARNARIAPLGARPPLPGEILVSQFQTQTIYWEYLTTVTALHYISAYSYVAPTTTDSTGAANPPTAFMIAARNSAYTMVWLSAPAFGYSVDNLAPVTPALLTGSYSGGVAHLHWNPNAEPDLAGYRIYRGASPSFVPGAGNLIASPPDTGYADPGGAGSYYKLSALDAHGNESGFALLAPAGSVAVGGHTSAALALAAPWPNPASGVARLGFALPRSGHVSLAIFDAGGRRVRSLVEGVQAAGDHACAWDLRDDSRRAVASGLYFIRLEVEGHVVTRRLAATR